MWNRRDIFQKFKKVSFSGFNMLVPKKVSASSLSHKVVYISSQAPLLRSPRTFNIERISSNKKLDGSHGGDAQVAGLGKLGQDFD